MLCDKGRDYKKYIGIFCPFLQRNFPLYFRSLSIYTFTLSSVLSYTQTHLFSESIKIASSALCGVFEETLCECLLPA